MTVSADIRRLAQGGFTDREIVARTGSPMGTVKRALSRLRKREGIAFRSDVDRTGIVGNLPATARAALQIAASRRNCGENTIATSIIAEIARQGLIEAVLGDA